MKVPWNKQYNFQIDEKESKLKMGKGIVRKYSSALNQFKFLDADELYYWGLTVF